LYNPEFYILEFHLGFVTGFFKKLHHLDVLCRVKRGKMMVLNEDCVAAYFKIPFRLSILCVTTISVIQNGEELVRNYRSFLS